jgi:Asp-tRNA(Asn)/Glu-tRNA(Gln) amidotransferase A subunit family amidase
VIINVVANLLDYCAAVIPVTKVTKEDLLEEYNDITYPNDHFVKETRKSLQGTEGLPVAIQVCTRPFQEEQCLGIAKVVDDILNKEKK